MENWWKFYLSLFICTLAVGCVEITNETYHHLKQAERQKMSSDYVSLAQYTMQGSKKQMRILEKAVRIDPQNDQAWRNLSFPFLSYGLYKEWHEHSSMAIKLNAEAWQGWRGRSKLYYFRDYGGALYDLDATDTLTINKNDYAQRESVEYLRGLCYLGLKNHAKAEEYFKLYISNEKKSTGSYEIDAKVYIYLAIINNYNQAYEETKKVFSEVPKNDLLADHHFHIAFAHFMLGEIDEAAKHIDQAKIAFEEGDYHNETFYEVPNELYLAHIENLSAEISCFQ